MESPTPGVFIYLVPTRRVRSNVPNINKYCQPHPQSFFFFFCLAETRVFPHNLPPNSADVRNKSHFISSTTTTSNDEHTANNNTLTLSSFDMIPSYDDNDDVAPNVVTHHHHSSCHAYTLRIYVRYTHIYKRPSRRYASTDRQTSQTPKSRTGFDFSYSLLTSCGRLVPLLC